jgi:hypothetical protein
MTDECDDDITTRLDKIEAGQKDHVTEYHAFKAQELVVMVNQHDELVKSVPQNRQLLEKVITILDGEEIRDIHGDLVSRTGGMRGRQAAIETDMAALKFDANGGRGFSVRTRDKVIIGFIAAIPSIAILIAALLTGGTP